VSWRVLWLLLVALLVWPLGVALASAALAPLFGNPPAAVAVVGWCEAQVFGLGWLAVRR
jgi:hypothetical protein